MLVPRSPEVVLRELASHPRGDDLARLVHTVAFAMADERRPSFEGGLTEAASRAGLTAADAETSFGNVLRALAQRDGDTGPAARALLGGLLARGVALSRPASTDAEARVAESLVWLATHTAVDALPALDAALGADARGLWVAIAALVRRSDEGAAPLVGRAGAIVAAAALGASASPAARGEARALAQAVRDPLVQRLLSGPAPASPEGAPSFVSGELVEPPRGPVSLALLAVTGLLFVVQGARLFARVVLRHRRRAELLASAEGVTVTIHSELLGRVLRDRQIHLPAAALVSATREVRYPRLALYVGLAALALGSYLGASTAVDGLRAGSPELIGFGALVVLVSIAIDYALTSLSGATGGRSRLVLVPRKGRAIAVGGVDPTLADAALRRLARVDGSRAPG
jgi:hypothetical protein